MARLSRLVEYAKSMGGQADKPALSIKDKLSEMKEKSKEVNKKVKEDS
ncbi:hypothetical protein [Butyrivibrio sp. FC2001]|nr:hypothetical protein [Butyrivibrio sp. FC2001]